MNFSSFIWAIPFLGIIFSVSLMPLLAPKIWHRWGGFAPAFWTVIYLLGVGYEFGATNIPSAMLDPLLEHYTPFMALIAALYITSGGIFIEFPGRRGAVFNVCFLLGGSIIAGWMGTTGAAMLLIRPFLRANASRKYKTHLLVFFIFLVANIGGAITPLGDPPLFIGFLEGVDFFWFAKNIGGIWLAAIVILCSLFFIIDTVMFRREHVEGSSSVGDGDGDDVDDGCGGGGGFLLLGRRNLPLLAGILAAVTLCNFPGTFEVGGYKFSSCEWTRSLLLAVIAVVSLKVTPENIRQKNCFALGPLQEVAGLFAGIFITVVPIIQMLHLGPSGEFQPIFDWIAPRGEFAASRCFWASGLLSAFLDNAPTFLIFFHLISGNAAELMTSKAPLLTAISISTVFMGALTYIGNAPNLMVKSVWEAHQAPTPSFMGYLVWSIGILVPLFYLISLWL